MSEHDAIGSLQRLGLSSYEARVFVALQRLGTGTAEEVSDVSEVPRSQVYGAADDLAERGLIEVVEATPKRYRPVSLDAAREQLAARLQREQERAFESLDAIRETEPARTGGQDVSTLRGHQPIDERIGTLIGRAKEAIALVAPAADSLSADIVRALHDQAAAGVDVAVLTAEPEVAERFDESVRVVVMDEDNPADFAGRALMVDGTTVLLAVATDDREPVEEEALWTADTSIGRILAQFMQSGMESGTDRQGPPDGTPGQGR